MSQAPVVTAARAPLPAAAAAQGDRAAWLIGESRSAELSHLVLAGLCLALLTGRTPPLPLLGLGAAVVALIGLRRWIRLRALARGGEFDYLRWVRPTLLALGTTWGLGAALAMRFSTISDPTLPLVLVVGLAGAGTITLAADTAAFALFLAGLAAPTGIAIYLVEPHGQRLFPLVLLVSVAAMALAIHRRAQAMVERLLSAIERARAGESAAREDHGQLEALFRNAPASIAWTDAKGRILGVNRRFETLFGWSAGEAVGRDLNELVVPAPERARAIAMDARVLAGDSLEVEAERLRRDGRLVSVRAVAAPVTPGKRDSGLLVMYEDVTENRRAEEAMRDSEERFRLLTESIPLGIMLTDRAGHPIYSNPAWLEITGLGAVEMASEGWLGVVHPEEQAAVAADWARSMRAGREFRLEFRVRSSGGAVRAVNLIAVPARDVSGGLAGFVASAEDITERRRGEVALREAERQYREMVESASDLVWQVDREGRWTYLNATAQRIYGRPPEQLIGQPFAAQTHPARLGQDTLAFQRVFGGAELTDHETIHVSADGTSRRLSFAARPLRGAEGGIVGAHGIARDVSERAAAAEALAEARDTAERAARTRSAFLANMSHEIRTPMNGVLGLTELLMESDLTPSQRRSVELIRTSGESLLTILNDILDFSKIEADHLEIESVGFDVPYLVDSAVRILAMRARERGIEVLADVAAGVPARIKGDPTRLRQVLNNLISNAIKFTHQGEVVVRVEPLEAGRDGACRLRFVVKDTGIGIAPEHLPRLFEEFTQADSSTTRRYGGTGLGLAISRRLVTLMGGELSVRSRLGEGSEFSFELTLPVEVEALPTPPRALASLTGRRVLVVDDNATNREILHGILSGAGMSVEEASCAGDAYARLLSSREEGRLPALILLDANMPYRDGFDLAADIRREAGLESLPLLLLTSAGRRGDAARCRELSIQGYLTKPVSRVDLIEAVATLLAENPDRAPEVVTRHSIAESREKFHILLAEDNQVNQLVAATMLRRRGHEVDIVANGQEAVDAVRGERYDLILMDVQMPVMDGFEATEAIRNLDGGDQVPIVALTAHALGGERERCLARGMNDYLTKPFAPQELFAAVESWSHRGCKAPDLVPPAEASAQVSSQNSSGFDLAGFLAGLRQAGIEDAAEAILAAFEQSAPARMEEILLATQTGDHVRLKLAAHAFKGAALGIHAHHLGELLQAIELAARDGHTALDEVTLLVREAEGVFAVIREAREARVVAAG